MYPAMRRKKQALAPADCYWDELCMLAFAIDHMTGKQCVELL